MKKEAWFSMIPLGVCLIAALLLICHMAAQACGYDLMFYCGWGVVLLITAVLTALLAALVFAETKLNRFGEACASVMMLMIAPCAAAFVFTAEGDWTFFAGLWLIGWTVAAFNKHVLRKELRWTMGVIGGLAAGLCIVLMTGVLMLAVEYPVSEEEREQAQYVSCVSPDGSEIAEAYFSGGMPHLQVRENNDGIDLKIARLTKQPIFIRFIGSGAIQSIEWRDENTLWIDNEAAYPIER